MSMPVGAGQKKGEAMDIGPKGLVYDSPKNCQLAHFGPSRRKKNPARGKEIRSKKRGIRNRGPQEPRRPERINKQHGGRS